MSQYPNIIQQQTQLTGLYKGHGATQQTSQSAIPNGHIPTQLHAAPQKIPTQPFVNRMPASNTSQVNGHPSTQPFPRPVNTATRPSSLTQSPLRGSPAVAPSSPNYSTRTSAVPSPTATPVSSLPGRYAEVNQNPIQNRTSQPQISQISRSSQANMPLSNASQIPNNIPPQQSSHHPSQQSANMAPGRPATGRRQYPQQIAPSIPTNYQRDQGQLSPTQLNQPMPVSMPNHQNQMTRSLNSTTQIPNSTNNMYQRGAAGAKSPNMLTERLTVEQSPDCSVNLLQSKDLIPKDGLKPSKPPLSELFSPERGSTNIKEYQRKNAKPDIMRCTLNAVPQTSSMLKQCKLPFGIYIHPFKENTNIPVLSTVITRCRSCRSYLNPFASIPDYRKWQCNICFRMNDLPEELSYDSRTRQYLDVRKRPELTSASVEFIAPAEYMLRPPQPSVFIFVLDVSYNAISTGYLQHACTIIKENLDNLPGDSRTKVAFITFNSSIHFYSLKGQSQPQMYSVADLDDVFLPVPDGLLVNVKENKDMILQLLESLPTSFDKDYDTKSATGAALLAGKKLVSSLGGRITLFQTCLPTSGPGKLAHRESSGMSAGSKDVQLLNPSTDFYKRLALDCAGEQIAIDIFLLAGQYSDLASLSGAARYSSGAIHYFPDFHASKNQTMLEKFQQDFKRYLTRSIGFEAVLRLRCTKGLSIHTFHGNFFVRSTDLLSLPNVNPDHSFSMQIAIDENLDDSNMVAFQTALLYTTTKGERRIRVHTLALPVTKKLSDVFAYADQQTVACCLSKLAVDRTLMSSLGDAREALMNACIDCLKNYRNEIPNQRSSSAVIAPYKLRLLPLMVLALMKNDAFKLGSGVTLDQRVFCLLQFKWMSFYDTMLHIYPALYSVSDIIDQTEEYEVPVMHASAEKLSRQGVYIMDAGKVIYLFVGRAAPEQLIQELFNVMNISQLPERMNRLPELNNHANIETRKFIEKLRSNREFHAILEIISGFFFTQPDELDDSRVKGEPYFVVHCHCHPFTDTDALGGNDCIELADTRNHCLSVNRVLIVRKPNRQG